jgi:hypothetical protein
MFKRFAKFQVAKFITFISLCLLLNSCELSPNFDGGLTANTRCELIDWHITGLWVINCPVAWIRVTNYNNQAIKDITFQYNTYDANGRPLDEGTFTIEGTVPPGQVKNFIELYLGLVDLYSERLSIKLISVSSG